MEKEAERRPHDSAAAPPPGREVRQQMKELLAWALQRARQQTLALATGIPTDKACAQAAPGEHHAVWTIGHLVLADSYFLVLLRGGGLPADFPELLRRYGPGAAPLPEAPRYHPLPELVQRLTTFGDERLQALAALPLDALRASTPDAVLAQSQPTLGHHLHALIFHEGYHAGRLASWRQRLQLPAVEWAFGLPRTR